MSQRYSKHPVHEMIHRDPGTAHDLVTCLNADDAVVLRSGSCFALLYPKGDCWHIQYAAGPLDRLSGLIYAGVPFMLPFVSFHRRFGDGEPAKYPTKDLYRKCLQLSA